MKRILLLGGGVVLVFLVLVLPNHPGTMKWTALNRFPLELPVLILTLVALRPRLFLPVLFATTLVLAALMKVADYGMFVAYNRPFNPVLDAFLVEAGFNLLENSVGRPLAIILLVGFGLLLAVLFFALIYTFRAWSCVGGRPIVRVSAGLIAIAFSVITVVDAGHALKMWKLPESPPGTSWTSRLMFKRAVEMQATAADLIQFRQDAAQDPYADATGLFDMIGPRDVILIYIESYGRTSFENPLYTDTHLATLTTAEQSLRATGFGIRSGWLTSPTAGGQSWLAHGTLSTGLWTSDNGRYNAMLGSGRKSLFHLAADAGFRTAAIMPAITMGWPESSLMGFERVHPAADIPYKGARFNWVTMPDQFTLGTYRDILGEDPRPDFIQIALISSHAPWVPIPPLLEWDQLGDGTVFTQYATQGPTPKEVWRDRDRVREQYRLAIDYALQATFSHVAQLGDEAPLILVVGDHQPAGFVSQIDSHDVPLHMIAPDTVLEQISHWDWTPSLIPDAEAPVWRMDAFRDHFIRAFTSPGPLAAR
ncbi:sulfatase-like hydrolase/transferase [Litoreibacter roseus]|uniref:Sulfatase N-terminal domain-containing protein n=1 Tax=Litoreibacter roseus TaxID=2601869 RepID=A0A6N6JGZ5_9RHOB|nr:sulfatase-like hydrolase/transferase [Litoreibacter roseus]GFE64659.1 hypothetical protein KIN_17330 [Litoreibacter roseus]